MISLVKILFVIIKKYNGVALNFLVPICLSRRPEQGSQVNLPAGRQVN
jgi:hypothetical protein